MTFDDITQANQYHPVGFMIATSRITILLLSALALGCAELLDLDGYGSGGSGADGGGAGGTVSLPACGDGSIPAVCAPGTPLGWSGPVALVESGAPCAVPFDSEQLSGLASVEAPAAMCACECQASAPNCQVTFSTFADLSCAIPESTYPFSQNLNCGAVSPAPQSVGSISATTAVTTSGSCTPVESEEVPAPSGDAVRVCAPSQPSVQDSCEQDSECVPLPSSPFQPRLCVYAEGDVACPGLGYSVPVTVARDGAVSDDRRCSDCDCPAPPVGESCSGSGETSGANGCDPLAIVPFDATCTLTQNFVKLSANLVATPGTCSATGGEPIGSFAATDPVTLCCTPTIE